jgi:molecular chaperone HscB
VSHPETDAGRISVDDPFALLGLPRSFRVDGPTIRAAHLRRIAAVHPDRAAGAEDELVRRSAELNEARRILLDPVSRAEALLHLAGGASEPASDAMQPAFLMEMLELREAADAALESGDRERVAHLRADAESRRDALLEALARDFDDGSEASLVAARLRLGALRAIDRLVVRLADAGQGGGA